MVAESADVSRSDVGAKRALSAESFVVFQQKIDFENMRFVVFYSCRMIVFQQITADDKMVEHAPLSLKFVCAEISFANAV